MKEKLVDIIDLKICSSLKRDRVYKKGASWVGPHRKSRKRDLVYYLPFLDYFQDIWRHFGHFLTNTHTKIVTLRQARQPSVSSFLRFFWNGTI